MVSGGAGPIGRNVAHVASMPFLEFSVKVIRHNNEAFLWVGLWKKRGRSLPRLPKRF